MSLSDIKTESWIARLPTRMQPYAILMRLDRPIGWWLLLLPAWWGIALGANGAQGMMRADIQLMVLFLLGAVLMRGAGCIINDIWDRDLDAQVERTKNRPLASGKISLVAAILFLSYLVFTSFIILLMTSGVTIMLGFLSVGLIVIYPLMKRVTWWPQAFLGLTFNFGALMGWGAATHYLSWEAFVLYVSAFFWTLGYDTIYAHQDKEDDALVGIKSTALLFGRRSKFWVSVFYILSFAFLMLALYMAQAGIVSYALMLFPAIHLMRQIGDWDIDDAFSSAEIFKSNRNYGLLVLLAILAAQILPMIEAWSGGELPEIGLDQVVDMAKDFISNF